MDNIEIEIQVKIENTKSLLEFLEKSAKFESEKHQIDEYFTPAHRNFLGKRPVNGWIRLRNANGNYFVNYKNWYYLENGKSHY